MAKIKGFGYAAIFTSDFAATYEFYAGKLGFKTKWSDGKRMAMLNIGKFEILLHGKSGKKKAEPSELHLHLRVDDIDAFHQMLKEKGVRVPKAPKSTPWGHRKFHVVDPNGIEWELYQAEK